jgi:hypothetical protein
MNLRKMIVELQQEKNRLDEAISALERLSRSISKRHGRPPRWLSEAAAASDNVDFIPPAVDPALKPPTN